MRHPDAIHTFYKTTPFQSLQAQQSQRENFLRSSWHLSSTLRKKAATFSHLAWSQSRVCQGFFGPKAGFACSCVNVIKNAHDASCHHTALFPSTMSVALDYTGSCSSWSGTPSIDEARRLPCTHALSSSLPSAITKRGLRTRNASHLEDSPLALHFHGTGKVTNSAAANIDERQDAAALQIQRAWRAWVKETVSGCLWLMSILEFEAHARAHWDLKHCEQLLVLVVLLAAVLQTRHCCPACMRSACMPSSLRMQAGSASPSQASCQTVSDVQSSLCAPADAERASSGASCSTSSSSSSGATAASLFHQYSRPHRFHASKPRVWPRYHKSLSVHVPPPDSELPPHEVDAILGGGFWAPSADRVPRHGSKRVTAPAAGASAASSTISLFMQQRMRRMQREAEEALEMLRWKEVVRIACTVKHRAGGAGAKLRRAMQEVWVTAVGLCCGYNVHVVRVGTKY